jgi:hypothetical protein
MYDEFDESRYSEKWKELIFAHPNVKWGDIMYVCMNKIMMIFLTSKNIIIFDCVGTLNPAFVAVTMYVVYYIDL